MSLRFNLNNIITTSFSITTFTTFTFVPLWPKITAFVPFGLGPDMAALLRMTRLLRPPELFLELKQKKNQH
jgi:hypothetical protein